MTNPDQPRFLITRLSAIGDCILTMPLACALRDAFPDAWIGWVTEKGCASLLQEHAALDEVIIVPKQLLYKPKLLVRVRRQLQALDIDTTLDPQGFIKSSVLGWLSGAKRRIGFRAPVGRELSPWFNNTLVTSKEPHVVDRYRELLAPLGVQPGPVRFDVPRSAAALQSISAWLYSQQLDHQPLAVLNPGAGWPSKLWPLDRFATVSRFLLEEHSLRTVVVWCGEQERYWAKQIVAGSGGAAILAPNTTLPDLAALLRLSTVFVGSDTGPLHLAAAVGLPCVGIYGPTPPAESGPYGEGHRSVQTYLQEGTCRERKKAPNLAMQAVTAEQVIQACTSILAPLRTSKESVAA
jgi:lipopolysaccharide heptosyltransferase I